MSIVPCQLVHVSIQLNEIAKNAVCVLEDNICAKLDKIINFKNG